MAVPEFQTYRTRVETRVVLVSQPWGKPEEVVGEYVVRAEAVGQARGSTPVQNMVEEAMARASKAAKVMAAGVDNTERNRLK